MAIRTMLLWVAVLTVAATAMSAGAGAPSATWVYWADDDANNLQRIRADGTDHQVLLSTAPLLRGLVIDGAAGKLYWSDNGSWFDTVTRGRICRANLDGSAVEVLYQAERAVSNGTGDYLGMLALDDSAGLIYFRQNHGSEDRSIYRMDLAGGNVSLVLSDQTHLLSEALELDPVRQKLYYSDESQILWSDSDGQNQQALMTAPCYGFSVDPANERLYGANWSGHRIWSAATSGSDLADIGVVYSPRDVVRYDEKLYFGNLRSDAGQVYQQIVSSNLDGSGRTIIYEVNRYSTPSDPMQFVVIPEPATLSLLAMGGLAMIRRSRR